MKALISRIFRHENEYYRLTAGEEVPEDLPKPLLEHLIEQGWVESEGEENDPNIVELEAQQFVESEDDDEKMDAEGEEE